MPTNEKIAELLRAQTYDERMEFAMWLADTIVTFGDNPTAEQIASYLSTWAAQELTGDATP